MQETIARIEDKQREKTVEYQLEEQKLQKQMNIEEETYKQQ